MKLLNAFVGLAVISNPTEAKGKSPYRRRLQKTFDLIPVWSDEHLNAHPHTTDLLTEEGKENKTKFQVKMERITEHIYNMYEDRIVEIAAACPDTTTCQEYLDCTGEGDRMNTVRGRPAVELSDAYLEFVKEKWLRSRSRVFENPSCGFKEKKS